MNMRYDENKDGGKHMIFALIVMAVVAKILHGKGYTFERMIPFLLIAGIIGFIIPVGPILAFPFKVLGSVFGAIFGGLGGAIGGVIGGLFGFIGGILGAVFGLIGAVIGIVFGAIGIVFGAITMVFIPLVIIFLIVKLVR
jgi:hypothetical protein